MTQCDSLTADVLEKNIFHLSEQLGFLLLTQKNKIATAESCTGGAIAAAITKIPGSSQWFEYGIVSYANHAKINLLKVDENTLETQGAVSEAVVQQMALGVLKLSAADFAIAVSGIAGPDGGTAEKPVGTVWFAFGNQQNIRTSLKYFSGDRHSVQLQAVEYALQSMINLIHP